MMAIPKKKALPLKKVMLSEGAMPSEKPILLYVCIFAEKIHSMEATPRKEAG